MSFKIATLFESKAPPFQYMDTDGEIDFDSDSESDIQDYLAEMIEYLIEERGIITVVDENWEEGYRDMFNPDSGHYTVPDGYDLSDWEFKAPEKIILAVPYTGTPKEELIPEEISVTQGFALPSGGGAEFDMTFPVVNVTLDSAKSLIVFTLGESTDETLRSAEPPEPPEPDFDEPDYDYDYY